MIYAITTILLVSIALLKVKQKSDSRVPIKIKSKYRK